MNTTARALVERIRLSIKSLAILPEYGSNNAVYRDLAARSGISASLIVKIYSGEAPNPTADTIDALLSAIKGAMQKIAA